MADIIDVVTRLSFELQGQGLNKTIQQWEKQAATIKKNEDLLKRQKQYYSTAENQQQQKLAQNAIDRTTTVIDRQTKALLRNIDASKAAQAQLRAEIATAQQAGKLQESNALTRMTTGSLGGFLGRNATQIGRGVLQGAGIAGGYSVVTAVVAAVADAVRESAELGRRLETVSMAFTRLNQPNLLNNLRTATQGTISDLDLMQKAIQSEQFGIPLDRLPALLEYARVQARRLGRDVDDFTNRLVTGIAYQSTRRLDDLGLSQKAIREEVAKTGDFATGVYSLIDAQVEKYGESVLTAADAQAQLNVEIENTKAQYGGFFAQIGNELRALGLDFISNPLSTIFNNALQATGNPALVAAGIDPNSRYQRVVAAADRAKEAQEQQLAEAIQADVIYEQHFKALYDEYVKSDFNAREKIVAQANAMFEKLQLNALLFQQKGGLNGAFGLFNRNIANDKLSLNDITPGDLRNLRGEQLSDLLTQARGRFTDAERRNSSDEAELAANREIIKALQKEVDLREGSNKAGERRNKLTDHYLDLQKQIVEEERKLSQARLDRGFQTEDSIIDSGSINAVKRIERLNEIEAEYRRRGELTAKNIEQFKRLRELADQLNDAEVYNALREFYAKQDGFQEAFYLKQLEQQKDQAEALLNSQKASYQDTYDARLAFQDRLNALEQAQLFSEEDKAVKAAQEQGLDLLQVREYYEVQLQNLMMRQNRAKIEIEIEYYQEQQELIKKFGDMEIAENNARAAKLSDNIRKSATTGNLGIGGVFRRNANLDYDTYLRNLATDADTAAESLRKAVEQYYALRSLGASPADLANARFQVNQAQAAFTGAQNSVTNAAAPRRGLGLALFGQRRTGTTDIDARSEDINRTIDLYESLQNAAVTAYQTIADAQRAQLEASMRYSDQQFAYAQKLAERGNTEALRQEQERRDKLLEEEKRAAREQAAVNAALQVSYAGVAIARAAAEGGGIGSGPLIAAVIASLAAGYAFIRSLQPQGFEEGGYTGDGRNNEPKGIVHANEFVMNAETTKKYRPILEAMHEGRFDPVALSMPFGMTNTKTLEKKLDRLTEAVRGQEIKVNQVMDRYGLSQTVTKLQRHEERKWR